MKRLTYLFAATLFPLSLAACSTTDAVGNTDGDSEDADEDEDDSDSAPPSTTASTTVTPTSTTDASTGPDTDEPTTTIEPTTDGPTSTTGPDTDTTEPSGSSSTAGGCTDADECITEDDCDVGQLCLGCTCVDDPNAVCPGGWGAGTFADCSDDPMACAENETCIGPPAPLEGDICLALNECESVCDCPEPPAGFEDIVTCDDVTGDMMDDCFLSCAMSDECPDSMYCAAGICVFGEDPGPHDPYGNCGNVAGVCPPTVNSGNDGFCLPVTPAPGGQLPGDVCSAADCDDAADCPVPADGTAVVTCSPLNENTDGCTLDCSMGETCPTGMTCSTDFGICYWEPTQFDEYGECFSEPGVCPDAGLCVGDFPDPTIVVCATPCGDVGDCPAEPTGTGTSSLACVDIAGGDHCVLDCSGGATCPDGMNCVTAGATTICLNPVP